MLITVMLYMINQTMKVFVPKLKEHSIYNAALAIFVAIRGTSQIKLYKEFESLSFRRWFRQLYTFMVNLSIYSTRSHKVRFITILGILIKLRLIAVGQVFSKTLFFFTQ